MVGATSWEGDGRTRTGWGEGSRACELEQLRNISRQLARLVGWLLKRLKPFFLPHPPSLLPLPFRPFVVCDILWRFVSGSGGVGGRGIRFNNQLLHIFRCPCNVRRIGGGGRTGGRREDELTRPGIPHLLCKNSKLSCLPGCRPDAAATSG